MVKNLLANAGDVRDADSVLGSGRSPGGGHGDPLRYYFFFFFFPLRYSCLENSMDRGAWRAAVHGGYEESGTTEVT